MKKIFILAAAFLISSPVLFAQGKGSKKDTTAGTAYYTCSMHPEVKSDKPGKCPKCGMDLNLSPKEQMKLSVTKSYACPIHTEVTSDKPGKCPKCGKSLALSPKEKMKAEAVKLYTCPMHADVKSDKPGKCPKCGMDLTEVKK